MDGTGVAVNGQIWEGRGVEGKWRLSGIGVVVLG